VQSLKQLQVQAQQAVLQHLLVAHLHAVAHVNKVINGWGRYFMKDIRIYNFDKSKDFQLIQSIVSQMRDVKDFYISRSWERGPHIVVTFGDSVGENLLFDFKNEIQKKVNQIHVSEKESLKIKEQYTKSLRSIAVLEQKNAIDQFNNHGDIEINETTFSYFNQDLTNIIHNMRFDLQPILQEVYFYVNDRDIQLYEFYPILFHSVSETYKEDGRNKGYFSFISHVHGFLELAAKQNLNFTENTFEEMFTNQFSKIQENENEHYEMIMKWQKTWSMIYEKYKPLIIDKVDNDYNDNIDKTIRELEKNFTNDFHKSFVMYYKDNEFISNTDATTYRFIVNVLYLSLPFLKISALKKQHLIYMSYRFTEEKYNLRWRKELGIEV
jgi:hypothetical protein